MAVGDGVPILIISFSATVILGVSLGFRCCRLFTLFLVLNFCDVGFSIRLSSLALRTLYYEVLLTSYSCIARMFAISCCCSVDPSFSCRIALAVSSLSLNEPVL